MERARHMSPSTRPAVFTAAAAVVLVTALLGAAVPATPSGAARTCWRPPVSGTVVDPFRAPACIWCAGNRGLDYRVAHAAEVTAAASGRVEFAGLVVGVRYVVVRLANGWRHTYGQLTSSPLSAGEVVFAGGLVGRASNSFFFSVRVGDDYVDPAPMIGELRTSPRLIPVDATPARPAPPARPRCRRNQYRPQRPARPLGLVGPLRRLRPEAWSRT